MKKKFFIAVFLLIGFISVLSIFSKDQQQPAMTEKEVKSKPSREDGISIYKGENDFWKAEFTVTKEKAFQLKLKHKEETELPKKLSFTLMTAYDQNSTQQTIGEYTLSFSTFPQNFSVNFDGEKIKFSENKNLVLKITGEGHYQFFNLYGE